MQNRISFIAAAAFGILSIRIWDHLIAPLIWKARIRRLALTAGEPCAFDISPTTAPLFKRGGMALILKDIKDAGVPNHIREYFRCLLIARGADQAFRTKVELVNYKKVFLCTDLCIGHIKLGFFATLLSCAKTCSDVCDCDSDRTNTTRRCSTFSSSSNGLKPISV